MKTIMKKLKQSIVFFMVAALILPLLPQKSVYAGDAVITDDNFLGTGQITLNVNNTGSGYDFTNALLNPKTGSDYGGVGNMWELRLNGNTASCLNWGAHAGKGNIYTQASSASDLGYFRSQTITQDLQGLIYGYERLLGNHSKFGTSDPGYEQLSHFVRSDGILTAADCYMMMQVLTWRLSCGTYKYPSEDYEKALAHEIFYDLYGGDGANWKLNVIDEAYGYLMKCIDESRSGNYINKYSKVKISYYKADKASNQDLMTWDMTAIPTLPLEINKIGRTVGLPIKNATYAISYLPDMSYCFTQFTTNDKGKAILELEEGTYYIREAVSPAGAVLDGNTYTLTITDTISIYNLTDSEITNYLEFDKYEAGTENLITDEAEFYLYEWNTGKNKYLKVGKIHYDGNGRYSLNAAGIHTYHKEDGTAAKTVTGEKMYYTSANEGRFKIVETKAPAGWRVTTKEFTMNTGVDGYVNSFTTPSAGISEYPCVNALELEKKDAFTGELLSGAILMIQEKVGGIWYDVGELEECIRTVGDKEEPYYRTTASKTYSYHDSTGNVYYTCTNNAFPIHSTVYNNGQFRVVEIQAPKGYAGGWSRTFQTIATDYGVISFTGDSAAFNSGKAVAAKTAKYDSVTKEKIEVPATITVYEYIKVKAKWLKVGDLKFNFDTKEYECDNVLFKFHNEDGRWSGKAVDGNYLPGYLYYTTANLGKYKIVETKAPDNYVLGNTPYEKEINITADAVDGMIDLTGYENAAKNLGIKGDVNVMKYDLATQELVCTGDAVFVVYEKIGSGWTKVGDLKYNAATKRYESTGAEFTFHHADGSIIDTKNISDYEAGRLYYTTANQGRFKVAEIKAPVHYTLGQFSREFTLKADGQAYSYVKYEDGAKNLGISAVLNLQKYDVLTQEKPDTKNAVFTIQEYIADKDEWLDVANMKYDETSDIYTSTGQKVITHDKAGKEMFTNTEGNLYYTSANLGRYRVVETKAPDNYTAGSIIYVKEFNIVTDSKNGVIDFTDYETGAKNLGTGGKVKTAKYDAVTKEKVLTGNAEFTIYEYIKTMDKWTETGILSYNEETKEYTCDNVMFTFHDKEGNPVDVSSVKDYEIGKLYYTSANQGRFKIVETKAPENYTLGDFEKEFIIASESEQDMIDLTSPEDAAYNKGIDGSVVLLKADAFTEKPLAGAVFALQEWSESEEKWLSVGNLKDNEDGTYTTKGLKFNIHTGADEATEELKDLIYTTQNLGRYRIIEVKAPEGYLNDNYVSPELKLSEEHNVFELTEKDSMATDTPIRISISKKSVTTGKDIIGAALTAKDKDGNVIDTWVSDGTEHVISGIAAGIYTLTEESTPEGYVIARSIEFEVTETYDIQKVEMFDEEVKGKFIIHKKDKENGNALSGAVFELKDENGTVLQTLKTNENGYAESELLAFGIYDESGKYLGSKRYTVTETVSPNGYQLNRTPITVEFDYKDDKTAVVEKKLTVTNEKEPEVPTGDTTDMAAWIILLLAAITVMGTITYCKKKDC